MMIPQGPAKMFLIPFIGFLLSRCGNKISLFLEHIPLCSFFRDQADNPVGPEMGQPLLKNALDPD
jgi:hypothetical protein